MTICLIILFIFAYLLGSIPAGLLIARSRGVNIREVGSGNIGATNVFRSVGKGWGSLTFVFDALKGFVPVCLAPWLIAYIDPSISLSDGHRMLAGIFAIAGHNWPLFLKFKGGKGVATSAGVILGLAPVLVLIGLAAWLLLFVTSRYVSVASMGAAVALPIAGWIQYADQSPWIPMAFSGLGILIIWRHRSNLQRLMRGEENRFSFSKQKNKPITRADET